MADNFGRISAEARYVVPEVGQQPVSVSSLRAAAETKRRRADDIASTVADLNQSLDAANVGLAASYAALNAAQAEAKSLGDKWEFDDACLREEGGAASVRAERGAGSKRSRSFRSAPPAALIEANARVAAAKSAVSSAQAISRAADRKLKDAVATVSTDRARAARFDEIAGEIAAAEELVPVSLEEDAAQGVWAAPCFRWQRRGAIVPPPGAPLPALCTKASPTVKGFTPGLFVISCPHGYVYYLKLLRRGESPQVYYEFLRDRCRNAPRRVCYDNGCNLDCYVAARSPELTARMVVLIDRLHARNHVHCSSCYQLDRYTDYNASLDFNTQVAEHGNRPIQRAAPSVRFSTPRTAMNTLSCLAMVLASLRRQRNPTLAPSLPRVGDDGFDDDDDDTIASASD